MNLIFFIYCDFPGDYKFQRIFVNALGKESKSMKLRLSMRILELGVSFAKYMNSIQVKVGKNIFRARAKGNTPQKSTPVFGSE